jgi:transposase
MLTDMLMPWLPGLRLDGIDAVDGQVTVTLKSVQAEPVCPLCGQISHAVHSRYWRKVADLPWAGICVQLKLQARRLFCRNPTCRRVIFTERLPLLAAPHARRTKRMVEEQRQLALSEGGEAAARICRRQGMQGSGKTLLRFVCHAPVPVCHTPRVLGVDDWALCKGRTYGTILVDLELHQPVDLLSDRTSASLEQWLKEHPGVEIISRDRANDYAEGSRRGAPAAVQVADRFHLIKNIREMLERFLERNYISLRNAAEQVTQALNSDEASLSNSANSDAEANDAQFKLSKPAQMAPTVSSYEQLREQHRTKRLARYTEVRKLQAEGMGIRAIARQLKMSRDSVRRFMSDQFPERARRARRQSKLDPEELTTDDAGFVDKLYHECPDIRTVQTLALDFTQMLKARNSHHLSEWIEQAKASKYVDEPLSP